MQREAKLGAALTVRFSSKDRQEWTWDDTDNHSFGPWTVRDHCLYFVFQNFFWSKVMEFIVPPSICSVAPWRGYNTTLESMSSSADLYRCTEARLSCYRASLAIAGGRAVHTIGEQNSNALQKAATLRCSDSHCCCWVDVFGYLLCSCKVKKWSNYRKTALWTSNLSCLASISSDLLLTNPVPDGTWRLNRTTLIN